MKSSFAKLISENTSPLFRIMAGYDIAFPDKRRFESNVCAFHIGRGYFLSVSHVLIPFHNIPRSLSPSAYNNLISSAPAHLKPTIQQNYDLEPTINKYRWREGQPQQNVKALLDVFPQIAFDTRYPNLYRSGICTPYLLLQFKTNAFLGDAALNNQFTNGRYFFEPEISRHTFLLDLNVHQVIVGADVAIYKIDNQFSSLIPLIPKLEMDYSIYPIGDGNFFCLQGAPVSELGRMLHKSQIEGYIDHFALTLRHQNQSQIFEGHRYLIRGYFRFGSSGAPYLHYDEQNDVFKVNAIQSEACPLQMLIQGNRDNSAQYVNAIATPLSIIEAEIRALN
jgi:hypothetical protein